MIKWMVSVVFFMVYLGAGEVVFAQSNPKVTAPLRLGIERTELYFPLLKDKKVGVVAHLASVFTPTKSERNCEYVHLIDSLLSGGIEVVRIFSPEHGLRGEAEAGAKVESGQDERTGLPIISLYGAHKKPTPEDMEGLDVIIFDLQDVGARFYTYISTLHYVMEACAQAEIPLWVLDRPNPHIGAIDGPVLDTANCRSFVGMHPVPILYGLSIGEYAQMIQGEKWLKGNVVCDLKIIPMENYTRHTVYELPLPPSPNLQSAQAICAYPSLCLFEGTLISLGRGTLTPFTCYGFANSPIGSYTFTPVSIAGKAQKPPLENQKCRGFKVVCAPEAIQGNDSVCGGLSLNLQPLIRMYEVYPEKSRFFNAFFKKLAGTMDLEEQIKAGWSEEKIKASWQANLEIYRHRCRPYYLYPETLPTTTNTAEPQK